MQDVTERVFRHVERKDGLAISQARKDGDPESAHHEAPPDLEQSLQRKGCVFNDEEKERRCTR